MPKTKTFQDLSLTPPGAGQELWRWLYSELRAAILDGRLKAGARLPSTRSLALQYSLARGTVTLAFEQLHAEGYTRTEVGSGTYVASGLPHRQTHIASEGALQNQPQSSASLSVRAEESLRHIDVLPASHSLGRAFRAYEPAIDLFPVELWARTAARVLRRAPRSLYGQGSAGGYQPLRRAIAEYVGSSRGVRCMPEQIVVTSGAQQALDLIGRFLLDPGDRVWMEDPGYPGALHTFRAAGAHIVPVPVNRDGLNVAFARQTAPDAKLAYVTPANQFPLGVCLSADRRLELLQWAVEAGAWIIEDEYDAEYRYQGRPVAALQSLDRSGSVIYVGTFTKMLFNSLRLGFMVLPQRLVGPFEAARSFVDRHAPTLDQAILAEFITEGHFGRHVRRMRHTYTERMAVLKEAADRQLGGLAIIVDAAAGMRTLAWLHDMPDAEAARRARMLLLEVVPLSAFSIEHRQKSALVLGFAGCNPEELRRGVSVLARALTPG